MQIPRSLLAATTVIALTIPSGAHASIAGDLKSAKEFDAPLWEKAAIRAADKEDAAVLAAMLSAKTKGGNPASERRFRLFDVYRKKPEFYVREARKHFKGSLDCAVETLVPASGVIEPFEVTNVAAAIEKTGKASADLKAFRKRADEQARALAKGRDSLLELKDCR